MTPTIRFRNMTPHPAVEELAREKIAKLTHMSDRISRCEVMVEAPPNSHARGGLYHVRVQLHVPGRELVVGRDHGDAEGHADVTVAVRDAFEAMHRKLQDHLRKQSAHGAS